MGLTGRGAYHRIPVQPPDGGIYMTTATGHTQVIRAKKVIGTSVKNSAGEKIGQVEDIVLDKLSNNIVYAVVGFGGFLGMNEKYHPVPWSALDYVESEDSYVVPFTKDELKMAPADSLDKLTRGDGAAAYSASAKSYYKVS
jgi:sporulation protein YlmC with PRC-barrel domain